MNQMQTQQNFDDAVVSLVNKLVEEQQSQGLALPTNYNVQNAMKAAYLKLQNVKDRQGRPALTVCSKNSIVYALMDMAVQGLSPAKNQCYFIVYGTELQMQRSYFGTIAALKRLDRVKDIDAQVVHEGDEFEVGADRVGHLVVERFNPKFENLDKPLVGAFAFIELTDGRVDYTVMTKKQIDTSWSQSRQHGVQQKFGDEMAKRTVLNRAAKMFINTSDDSDMLAGATNSTTANEFEDRTRKEVNAEEKGTPAALLAGMKHHQEETKQEIKPEEKKSTPEAPEKPVEDEKEATEQSNENPYGSQLPFPEPGQNEPNEVAEGQTSIDDYLNAMDKEMEAQADAN
ncbi:recombinase RecT [Lactobacillus sp. 3B(2020)]|uniref:recombinase RecT n=1 Tax=Lactobacillus sp. 3B(2020) TaxID=2695882 RepID=UPI0015E4B12A|nr:RecT family recombinase [Lactobacillus sp. 3B(2020)]QLL70248.1 recombinase RecT [Lactobacillus sp. 3B(2020)]